MKILILGNNAIGLYKFRLELMERLLEDGYEVHVSSPYGEHVDDLIAMGVTYHEIDIDRHGMNPAKELRILHIYQKLIDETKPSIILGYTIKPNIYGAMAARKAHVPFIANITGLGTAVEKSGISQQLIVLLYKIAFKDVQHVFFQNEDNLSFFQRRRIAIGKYGLLPGSGVNLERYTVSALPQAGNGTSGDPIKLAFISRIMKEKGIDQYLEAAEVIKKQYPAVEFHICGFCEDNYKGRLEEMATAGIVEYHGMVSNVAEFMKDIHCIVHPTYYPEGLSNVLLEACACGRAIITTDRAGCREVVRDSVNGYMIAEKKTDELIAAIKKFIGLSYEQKRQMGMEGRRLVEERFNRKIVVEAYMQEIGRLKEKGYLDQEGKSHECI